MILDFDNLLKKVQRKIDREVFDQIQLVMKKIRYDVHEDNIYNYNFVNTVDKPNVLKTRVDVNPDHIDSKDMRHNNVPFDEGIQKYTMCNKFVNELDD